MKYNITNPDVKGVNVLIKDDPLYPDFSVHVKAKTTEQVELSAAQARYLDSAYSRLTFRTAPTKEEFEALTYTPIKTKADQEKEDKMHEKRLNERSKIKARAEAKQKKAKK